MTQSAIQRYLKRHGSVLNQANQPNQNEVTASLVVAAIPGATERVLTITKDLTVHKMAGVLEEAEKQYVALKDTDPQLAGSYLREMRQTLESMGKWLNMSVANQEAGSAFILPRTPDDPQCRGCFWYSHMSIQHLRELLLEEKNEIV